MQKQVEKKSKLKNTLVWIIIIFVIIGALISGLVSLAQMKQGDRLGELLRKEYVTPFVNKVTDTTIASFHQKVTNNTQLKTGGQLVVNNVLDTNKFFSNQVQLNNTLTLTNLDLLVLTQDVFKQTKYLDISVNDLINIYDVSIQNFDKIIEYTATFCVNLDTFFAVIPNLKNLPAKVYVTLSVSYNMALRSDLALTNYFIQVNRLTDEENSFAVNELTKDFGLTQDDIKSIARYPFTLITQCIQNWGVNFKVANNSFVFNY